MKNLRYLVITFCLTFILSNVQLNGQVADSTLTNTVVFIQNSTSLADQASVFSNFDQYQRPIWDKLTEEGEILGYGHLTHYWGDEFNHNVYFAADNKISFFKAWDRFFSELDIPTQEMNEIQSMIKKHKDNIYIHTAFYSNGENLPGAVMLNQNRVNLSDQGEWVSIFREFSFPILKKMVDDGKLNRFGLMIHEWGDDWNVNVYFHNNDLEQFNQSWGEYFSVFSEKHPEQLNRVIELTVDHKDNLFLELVPEN